MPKSVIVNISKKVKIPKGAKICKQPQICNVIYHRKGTKCGKSHQNLPQIAGGNTETNLTENRSKRNSLGGKDNSRGTKNVNKVFEKTQNLLQFPAENRKDDDETMANLKTLGIRGEGSVWDWVNQEMTDQEINFTDKETREKWAEELRAEEREYHGPYFEDVFGEPVTHVAQVEVSWDGKLTRYIYVNSQGAPEIHKKLKSGRSSYTTLGGFPIVFG